MAPASALVSTRNPLRALSLAQLRERTSTKWLAHPGDVLPLWVAEMDVPLAPPVTAALHDAIARGDTGYPAGTRYAEALAAFASARWGWDGLEVARTRVLADVMTGIAELLRVITDPGDDVVVASPVYSPFFAFIEHTGRRPFEAPLGADLRLDPDALDAAFAEAAARSARPASTDDKEQSMTDTPEPIRIPGRGEIFTSPAAKAVWAAILALPHGEQHLVLSELRARLACVEGVDSHETRVRFAIACLRDAAGILGRSPSVADYRELRALRPERRWPADGSLRTWLGGSWNDCLRAARLDTVPDGDVLVAQLGPAFSEQEVCEALRQCAQDLGDIPTLAQYYGWARRPDVTRRPGRRPQSQPPFDRLFGGYYQALVAAGLVGGDGAVQAKRTTLQRLASYRVTEERIQKALQQVASRLGRSPRVREYMTARDEIMREAFERGAPVALPAHSTIQQRYPVWDDALVAAGLEPLGGRSTASRMRVSRAKRRPRFADEELLAVLREAHAALGDPFTVDAYKRWRKARVVRDREARRFRRIPSYDVYYTRFETWGKAVRRALEDRDDAKALAA